MKTLTPTETAAASRTSFRTVAAYCLPVAVLATCVAIYAISPRFYLTWVLEAVHRETQAVEIATFLCGLAASVLLLRSLPRLWRAQWNEGSVPGLPGGPIIIAIITLATIFYTGEEISWGQSYLRWSTPDTFVNRFDNTETNLHNAEIGISVQALGSLFLIVMFIALPIGWRFRRKFKLPADWHTAIAPGPVVFTFLCAFAWARLKSAYMAATTEAHRAQSELYIDFIEQMKEHKELLFAMGLLMYAITLTRRAKEMGRGAVREEAPEG